MISWVKIFFIENYDIELAKRLVRGVDIWLNTPTGPRKHQGQAGEAIIRRAESQRTRWLGGRRVTGKRRLGAP